MKYVRDTPRGPVVVEARPILKHTSTSDPESVSRGISALQELARWCGGEADLSIPHIPAVYVMTPHGAVRAERGDWIVRESNGDYRVLPNSDFHKIYKNYEPAQQENEAAKRERLANELLELSTSYESTEKAKIEEVASILTLPPGGSP